MTDDDYTPVAEMDRWREALSQAVEEVECTDDERDELRDWLAQETPDRETCEWAAEDQVAEMLATIRFDNSVS